MAVNKAWIAALRSGKYKQGNGRLRGMGVEGYEYCCLGVGADVLRKQNPEVYGTWDGLSFKLAEQEPSGKQYLDVDLNHRLASALGIGDVIQSECVNWNDNLGLSFAEIADALEELW